MLIYTDLSCYIINIKGIYLLNTVINELNNSNRQTNVNCGFVDITINKCNRQSVSMTSKLVSTKGSS